MTYELEAQNKPHGIWKHVNSFNSRIDASRAMEEASLERPARAYRVVQIGEICSVKPRDWGMKGAEKI